MSLKVVLVTVLTSVLIGVQAGPAEAGGRSWGQRPVLDDRFDSLEVGPGRTWGWQSSAYLGCTANPDHWKLDRLTRSALSTDGGRLTITASPRPDGQWDTGLITTGESCDSGGNGALVRTGDLLLAHVRLPAANSGTWPGLWTWRDGRNEIDVFEWHADFPGTLEFANHVQPDGGSFLYRGPEVGAERWVWVGARFGADSVAWYVGTDRDHLHCPYADRTGVGADFSAHPILNLAVDDGNFHPAPVGTAPATLTADRLTIVRPAPKDLPEPVVVADQRS